MKDLFNVVGHPFGLFLGEMEGSDLETPKKICLTVSAVFLFLLLIFTINRISKQRLREAKIQAADYLILFLAGACLGSITKPSDQTFGATGYAHSIIAVCE